MMDLIRSAVDEAMSNPVKSVYKPSCRREMLRFISHGPQRTLEVGCREGGFSRALSDKFPGVETWGIDPDPAVSAAAAGSLSRFIEGCFPPPPGVLPEHHFDLIVFNDVLEHLADPWGTLRTTRNYLTDGGLVVASIPNVRTLKVIKNLLFWGRFDYAPSGALDISHLRFFTKRSIITLFEGAGFSVETLVPATPPMRKGERLAIWLTLGLAEPFFTTQYAVVARPAESTRPLKAKEALEEL